MPQSPKIFRTHSLGAATRSSPRRSARRRFAKSKALNPSEPRNSSSATPLGSLPRACRTNGRSVGTAAAPSRRTRAGGPCRKGRCARRPRSGNRAGDLTGAPHQRPRALRGGSPMRRAGWRPPVRILPYGISYYRNLPLQPPTSHYLPLLPTSHHYISTHPPSSSRHVHSLNVRWCPGSGNSGRL